MVNAKIKELVALRQKTALLEQQVAAERNTELATLPAKYGFENVADFIAALQSARGSQGGAVRVAKTATQVSGGRKPRAKITAATRAEVKKLVRAGKTGAEIAQATGISLPSVQNIKKALGLVRKR